jgi:hypothetical protein
MQHIGKEFIETDRARRLEGFRRAERSGALLETKAKREWPLRFSWHRNPKPAREPGKVVRAH